MIFSREDPDIPDLSGEIETGPFGFDPGEITFTVTQQDISEAGVETTELGQEAKLVTTQDKVGVTVPVNVKRGDGIYRRQLDLIGEAPDAEAASTFVKGDNGRRLFE